MNAILKRVPLFLLILLACGEDPSSPGQNGTCSTYFLSQSNNLHFTYNEDNRLASFYTRPSHEFSPAGSFTYDESGKLTESIKSGGDAPPVKTNFTYNENGQMIAMTVSNYEHDSTAFAYDNSGRMIKSTTYKEGEVHNTYSVEYVDGETIKVIYDYQEFLDETVTYTVDNKPRPYQAAYDQDRLQYTFVPASNITHSSTVNALGAVSTLTTVYQYNKDGYPTASGPDAATHWQTFAYACNAPRN